MWCNLNLYFWSVLLGCWPSDFLFGQTNIKLACGKRRLDIYHNWKIFLIKRDFENTIDFHRLRNLTLGVAAVLSCQGFNFNASAIVST